MSNKTMSDNACYASRSTPVTLSKNTPQNKMAISLYGRSDVNTVEISLYEERGFYWFSFVPVGLTRMNSVAFVSLQNCVAALRDTLRCLSLVLDDSEGLTRFVRVWNRQGRKVA